MENWRSRMLARPISWGALPPSYSSTARLSVSADQPHTVQRAQSPTSTNISLERSANFETSNEQGLNALLPDSQPDPTPFKTTKDWSLDNLLKMSPNFRRVRRVHANCADLQEIKEHHESTGIPLVIAGYHTHPRWPHDLFSLEGFDGSGNSVVSARNVHSRADERITKAELMQKLRDTPPFVATDEHERLYGKDMECPEVWAAQLSRPEFIPDHLLFNGKDDMLKHLPESGKVQTLMCYLGVGDTFTPFHKDPCGSIGQNIMVYTEKGGSSFWFMTEGSHALGLARYFQTLGHVLDWETYVATIEDLKNSPCPVYITEQKLGDMVIVPPRVSHQVVNYGGISLKVAWSRMSISSLKISLYEELPLYRRVCRAETYKVKAIIHHALHHYSKLLGDCTQFIKWEGQSKSTQNLAHSPRQREQAGLAKILYDLVVLYQDVIVEEQCPGKSDIPCVTEGTSPYKYDISCDYCGGDIFQSFFECSECVNMFSSSSRLLQRGCGICICPACYVEGRTCFCGGMSPVQCRPFDELLQSYNDATKALLESGLERSVAPLTLQPHQKFIPVRQHVALFEAACHLHALRSSTSPTEVCFSSKAGLPCQGCHRDTCPARLLNIQRTHASEVFQFNHGPDWSNLLHQFRKAGERIRRREQHATSEQGWKRSSNNIFTMLAHLAINFPESKALHPRTRHGWYDKPRTSITPDLRNARSDPELKVQNIPSHGDFTRESAPNFDQPHAEVTQPMDSPRKFPAKPPLRKKPRLDYVLAPFVKGISKGSKQSSPSTSMTLSGNDLDMATVESDDDDMSLPELIGRIGRRGIHLDRDSGSISTAAIHGAEQTEEADRPRGLAIDQYGGITSGHSQRDRRLPRRLSGGYQDDVAQVLDQSFRSNARARSSSYPVQRSHKKTNLAMPRETDSRNQDPRCADGAQGDDLRTVPEDVASETVGANSVNITTPVAKQANAPVILDNAPVRDKSPVSIRIEMSSSLSANGFAVFINPRHSQGGVDTSLTQFQGIVPASTPASLGPNTPSNIVYGGPAFRSQWPRDTNHENFAHPDYGYGHQWHDRPNAAPSHRPYDNYSSNPPPRRGRGGKAYRGFRRFKPYSGFQPHHAQCFVNEGGYGPRRDRAPRNTFVQPASNPTESRNSHLDSTYHPSRLMSSTATQTGRTWSTYNDGSTSSDTRSNFGMRSSPNSSLLSGGGRPASPSPSFRGSATFIAGEAMHERQGDQRFGVGSSETVIPRRRVSPSEREVSLECMD